VLGERSSFTGEARQRGRLPNQMGGDRLNRQKKRGLREEPWGYARIPEERTQLRGLKSSWRDAYTQKTPPNLQLAHRPLGTHLACWSQPLETSILVCVLCCGCLFGTVCGGWVLWCCGVWGVGAWGCKPKRTHPNTQNQPRANQNHPKQQNNTENNPAPTQKRTIQKEEHSTKSDAWVKMRYKAVTATKSEKKRHEENPKRQ